MPQGRPIYIQHLGQINVKRLEELTTEERMIKFHVQVGGWKEGGVRRRNLVLAARGPLWTVGPVAVHFGQW